MLKQLQHFQLKQFIQIIITLRLLGVNILTLSKRKVIISIFHNLEKVPVRCTGAYRHKKSTVNNAYNPDARGSLPVEERPLAD